MNDFEGVVEFLGLCVGSYAYAQWLAGALQLCEQLHNCVALLSDFGSCEVEGDLIVPMFIQVSG